MSEFLLCYGPPRGAIIVDEFSEALLSRFAAACMVTYDYDTSMPPVGFRSIRVEDPGTYPVAEVLQNGRRYQATSNSLRQFTQMREGLKALRSMGGQDEDLVVILRSDLALISEVGFQAFLTDAFSRLCKHEVQEVRLTTNSISPFSFTGHGIHGSDWVIICSLGRLTKKLAIDPKQFASGTYSTWERLRKGPFCYGAFAAEELFSVAHYGNSDQMRQGSGLANSVRVSFYTKLRFLRDTHFVAPGRACITLEKWQYLHSIKATAKHPFGPGPKARLKSLLVWISFSSELVPASGKAFWGLLALKAMLSWMIQIPRQIILACQDRS